MTDTPDDTPLHGPARIARRPTAPVEIETEEEARAPVADLCAPISARVMPKSALTQANGGPLREAIALRTQRSATRATVPPKGRKG